MNASSATKSKAFILMTASMFCFACMGTAIHGVQDMHITQMVFIRNVLSLGLMTAWFLWIHKGFTPLKTDKLKQHFFRSLVGVIGMHLWFASLILLPLNTAMALSFTIPIFSTILAGPMLGERVGIRRWSAVIVGFLGVLVIIPPGMEIVDSGTIVALSASMVIAITGIMIKSLTRTDHPVGIIYYMTIFMTLFSLPLAIYFWDDVSVQQFNIILLIAIFSMAAHMLMTRAFQMADLTTLMPIDYTRLIFTAILAYFFFSEVITINTIMGAAIIAGSGLYIARREAMKHRKKPPINTA